MGYVESREDPLIQVLRTRQYQTNSKLLQTVKNFRKSFRSGTKQIETHNSSEHKKFEEKRMNEQFSQAQTKNWWIRNSPTDG